jgi:serine protease AprX
MKLKITIVLLLALSNIASFSQNRYVIKFTDKTGTPYSISNPSAFLSPRAINRRVNHGIAITTSDLPVNPTYIAGVQATGATVLNKSKWLNSVTVDITNPSQLTAINALPYVAISENVGRITNQNTNPTVDKFSKELIKTIPQNTIPSNLRTGSFDYGMASNQTSMIGLNNLHDSGYSGSGMLIAVLDAGFFDANNMDCFDSLFANNQIIATWDFVDNEANVYDNNYHGASVLSCMAANKPGEMIGTAPNAKYILLRSEDTNSENIIEEYNYAAAAEFADSMGADLIHASLGYYTFDITSTSHSYADMDGNTAPATIAADMAASKGILVVSSAGNEGNSNWNYIGTPADGDSVLAIGAVDQITAQYVGFSSNGPSYDGRVKPDVAAVGQGTYLYYPGNSTVAQGNGTSFSGPIIAGAAACLWQAWPGLSNMEIIQAIKESANQFTNPDTLLGYGIPNFTLANSILNLGEVYFPKNDVLHVYPNPWSNNGTLTALYLPKSNGKIIAELFDASGKLIFTQSQNVIGGAFSKILISDNISNGIYLLKVTDNNKEFTKKVIRE